MSPIQKSSPSPQLLFVAVLGFSAVALGAFGAHGLKSGILAGLDDGAQRLAWWETGVRYQMWHALFMLGVNAVWTSPQPGVLRWIPRLVGAGVVLFSGSLYAMTLSGVRWLGAITPLGGLAFLAAWCCLFLGVWRQRRDEDRA